MATPKDWVVYVDSKGKTRAVLDQYTPESRVPYQIDGNKIIGYVSSGSEEDAVKYADEVLR